MSIAEIMLALFLGKIVGKMGVVPKFSWLVALSSFSI